MGSDGKADFLGACLWAYAQGASDVHRSVLVHAAVGIGVHGDDDTATQLLVSACQSLLELPLPQGLPVLSPSRQAGFLVWLAGIVLDGKPSLQAQVLYELGLHYMLAGDRPLFARRALRRSLSLRLGGGDSESRVVDSLTQLAVAFDLLGRYDRALRLLRLARRLLDMHAIEPRPRDACLRLLAAACAREGDLRSAVDCLDAARPLSETVYGRPPLAVDVAWTTAICAQAFLPDGKRSPLAFVMSLALQDLHKGRDPADRFTEVDGLPHALARTPRKDLALLASLLTVRLAEELPGLRLSVEDRCIIFNNLGNALLQAGWNERALAALGVVIDIADGDLGADDMVEAGYQRLHALGGIGFAHYNQAIEAPSLAGRLAAWQSAAAAFDAAQDMLRRVGSRAWFEGRIWACAGMVDVCLGRMDGARRRFAMALLAGRANWSTAPDATELGVFFNPDSDVHEKLTEGLERLGAHHAAVLFGKAAVHAVHRESLPAVDVPLSRRYVQMRSNVHRRLVRCLAAAGRHNEAEQAFALLKDDAWGLYVRRTDVPIEVESGVALTRAETAGIERAGLAAVVAGIAAKVQASEAAVEALAAALTLLDDCIAAEVARLENQRGAASVSARRGSLAEGDARLRYVVSAEATSITVETRRGLAVERVAVSFGELSQQAFALRQAGRGVDKVASHSGVDAARQLGLWLIAPVLGRLDDVDHLWIEVDSPLEGVPFAALACDQRPLMERFSIAFLNPAGPDRPPAAQTPACGASIAVFACSELPGARLPGAAAEAEAIAALAARHGPLPRLERHGHAQCTIARWLDRLQRPGQSRSAIHLATHAEFNATSDALSVLALADGGLSIRRLRRALEPGGTDVGVLVLSACGTARRDIDVEGFSATLLRAGAAAVVSSLWETLDAGAPAFFAAFYADFYAAGDDFASPRRAARALRQAQRSLASGDGLASLDRWAPYVLTSSRVA